ncbi:MAG: DUF1343 domain-containing protein, partial [Lachnospiraceae bacterium]|nr:DUF1343 domain-containing protein [Lachnospiraceae bacterium]
SSVESGVDEKTGVPIYSAYSGSSHAPTDAEMDTFDVMIVDIQDVGVRYYTYYITMYYLMDACSKKGKEVIVLDRPNPNGFYTDGPILKDGFHSGVGVLPIPVVHGMTIGELALMINGEGWLSAGKGACKLTVVPCDGYTYDTKYALLKNPSPNLKSMHAIYLYPSVCYFENTAVSVGRGTNRPFEVFGSPYLEGGEYTFSFTPVSMEGATSPVFEGQVCYGQDLGEIPDEEIFSEGIDLSYLIDAYRAMQQLNPSIDFFGTPSGGQYYIDKLFGTDSVRKQVEAGKSAEEIEASWQTEIEEFCRKRAPYRLYE